MKGLFTSFLTLLIFITISSSFVCAYDGVRSYQFRTAQAKDSFFKDSDGQKCIDSGPKVNSCGTAHLLSASNQAAYEKCIKDIKLPTDFEASVLTLQPQDFKSQASFDEAFSDRVVLYAKSVDDKFDGPADKNSIVFSFNWLALILLIVAFAVVYLLNRKTTKTSHAAEQTSQV